MCNDNCGVFRADNNPRVNVYQKLTVFIPPDKVYLKARQHIEVEAKLYGKSNLKAIIEKWKNTDSD